MVSPPSAPAPAQAQGHGQPPLARAGGPGPAGFIGGLPDPILLDIARRLPHNEAACCLRTACRAARDALSRSGLDARVRVSEPVPAVAISWLPAAACRPGWSDSLTRNQRAAVLRVFVLAGQPAPLRAAMRWTGLSQLSPALVAEAAATGVLPRLSRGGCIRQWRGRLEPAFEAAVDAGQMGSLRCLGGVLGRRSGQSHCAWLRACLLRALRAGRFGMAEWLLGLLGTGADFTVQQVRGALLACPISLPRLAPLLAILSDAGLPWHPRRALGAEANEDEEETKEDRARRQAAFGMALRHAYDRGFRGRLLLSPALLSRCQWGEAAAEEPEADGSGTDYMEAVLASPSADWRQRAHYARDSGFHACAPHRSGAVVAAARHADGVERIRWLQEEAHPAYVLAPPPAPVTSRLIGAIHAAAVAGQPAVMQYLISLLAMVEGQGQGQGDGQQQATPQEIWRAVASTARVAWVTDTQIHAYLAGAALLQQPPSLPDDPLLAAQLVRDMARCGCAGMAAHLVLPAGKGGGAGDARGSARARLLGSVLAGLVDRGHVGELRDFIRATRRWRLDRRRRSEAELESESESESESVAIPACSIGHLWRSASELDDALVLDALRAAGHVFREIFGDTLVLLSLQPAKGAAAYDHIQTIDDGLIPY